MKIKDENGNEIEVFTPDELQQKTKEAVEAKEREFTQKLEEQKSNYETEVKNLKEKADKAESDYQAALSSGGNKEQIERLRNERDLAVAATGKITELENKIKEFENKDLQKTKNSYLDKYSNGDKELREKMEIEFDKYRSGENTPEAIAERAEKAYQLVTGNKPTPGVFDGGTTSFGGRGQGNPGGSSTQAPSQNQVAIGNALGITDEDRKKADEFYKNRTK